MNSKEKQFFENFKYFKICKNLFNSFQKRNVNILMYEDLKNNKKKFANKISKIFELNLNETYKFINKNNLNKSTNLNKKIFIRKKHSLILLLPIIVFILILINKYHVK